MTFNSLILFDPNDWYWISTDGRIYSSARNKIVYSYDFAYVAFLQAHGAATPWPKDASGQQTNAALQAVLLTYGINVTIPTQ